jgi:hypothetical protein
MNQDKIKHIANHYGIENQLKKTMEELSELGNETFCYMIAFLGRDEDITTISLIDEIADVKIMLAQLEYLLEFEEEVNDRVEFKLNRQMDRIKLEKESVQHEM